MTPLALARAAKRRLQRFRGQAALAVGRVASSEPLSVHYGYERGTPVDRHYIDAFLVRHARDIRGSVLEVGDSAYSTRFGGKDVTQQHVLDVDPGNSGATIVGDVCDPAVLPSAAFDCIIFTQTLHVLYDMRAALVQLRRSLKPGGVLLVTAPGITPVRPGPGYGWFWSLTGEALERLLGECFDAGKIEVAVQGNLFAATAFLHGAAVEEIRPRKLERVDLAYPVLVTGRAVA